MVNNQTTEQAELNRMVELGQALQRLENNPDFVEVIKNGYIMQTLVADSQNTIDQAPPVRQEAFEKIQSVNYFRHYLTTVRLDALNAVAALNGEDDE